MFDQLTSFLKSEDHLVLILVFFTAVIVLYSIFVFHFYRFLAKKNIIELNLNQYNNYSHPLAVKILAAFFFIIEYVVLLPILTFFWFAILSILTLLLAKDLQVHIVLLISAALVAAVRVTSYVSEDLSKDLAKMLPFTLLAIAITTAGFFNINDLISRISEIPSLFANVPYYLLFMVSIELVMRVADFLQSIFQSSKAEEDKSPIEQNSESE
jgi:hypothetical protein